MLLAARPERYGEPASHSALAPSGAASPLCPERLPRALAPSASHRALCGTLWLIAGALRGVVPERGVPPGASALCIRFVASSNLFPRRGLFSGRVVSALLWGVAACGLLAGCKAEAPDPSCDSARERARAAAMKGDLEPARAALTEARASCSKKLEFDLARIEQLIERKQQREQEVSAREQARRDKRAALAPFTQWIGELRESDNKKLPGEVCAPRAAADFGFCTGSRVVTGDLKATLRYRTADATSVFMFRVQVDKRAVCSDLGPARLVHEWKRGNDELTHCEPTAPPLKGLVALLTVTPSGAAGDAGDAVSDVQVFSRGYLDADPKLTALLRSATR